MPASPPAIGNWALIGLHRRAAWPPLNIPFATPFPAMMMVPGT